MTGLAIDIDDQQVLAVLRQLADRLDDLTPALDDVGAALESRVQQRFDLKQDPEGNPWAAWAPSTAELRAKQGRGSLLELTRRMRNSLNHQATRDEVKVGFGVPYAIYHEYGTRRMPRRGLLLTKSQELAPDDQRLVLEILEEYLADASSR